MNATQGFFQKCQQYFRGNNPSQNYEVESDEHEDDDESFTSKLSNFGRSYQKVSTEDNSTKYVKLISRKNDVFPFWHTYTVW